MSSVVVSGLTKSYTLEKESLRGRKILLRDRLQQLLRNPISVLSKSYTEQKLFFALKNVSFTLEKGETLGVIGRNGSGKSTLLKLLAGITFPTEGVIKLHGSVATILEIGAGFHPDLTGRENMYLTAALHGIERKTLKSIFPEIVRFSQIQPFLDIPVKYYSSGMYLRLAFAISTAHRIQSDILLIDEVFAIGDLSFQQKSLKRINELVKNDNKTVIFVSHDLTVLQKLCKRSLWLEKGEIKMLGMTKEVIENYIKSSLRTDS